MYYDYLFKNKVVGIKPEGITLKSGRTSYWYANCRNLTDTVQKTKAIQSFVMSFIKGLNIPFDYIYGVPEGITKLALACNLFDNLVDVKDKALVMGRGKPKAHGDPKDMYFVGPIEESDQVIVIEDVTTTGGSLISELEKLDAARVKVVAVVALFNRCQKRDDGIGVAEKLEQLGYKYFAMANADKYLPWLIRHGTPWGPPDWDKVKDEMEETGVTPITW